MNGHPSIVYAGGFWATNIGNAFYNLGLLHILKESSPEADIYFLNDQAGWFWRGRGGGNPSNDLNYLQYINPDFLVLAGPLINEKFIKIWGPTLKILSSKGVNLALLSVGCSKYNDYERNLMRGFFEKYPPHILMSRDQYTYDNFNDLAMHAYSGVCSAFFVPYVYKPIETDLEKYLIFNFDKSPEPEFKIVNSHEDGSGAVEFNGLKLQIKRKNRFNLKRRSYTTSLGDYKIVRAVHSCIPNYFPSRIRIPFRRKNSFVSDIPYGYLNLYANTQGTFSDRVHACVVTLAYGNPAMLFSESPRSNLFERFGLNDIWRKPVLLDREKLDIEKERVIEFLRGAFTIGGS